MKKFIRFPFPPRFKKLLTYIKTLQPEVKNFETPPDLKAVPKESK
jgi:hypothetical protein